MSGTNWKILGRKQGGNMKNYRNVRSDKSFYNNGKWETVYTNDDIKRLAYYNVDLPHVVGIGTKTPFSKLSFGDSSNSGYHPESFGNIDKSNGLTAGKISAIAVHEKAISKALDDGSDNTTLVEGQDFKGLSYVTNLRSIRKTLDNTEATGIGIFSNKPNVAKDTSLKTDKAVMYITDDSSVHIGGVPSEYQFIDKQTPIILPGNISTEDGRVVTGPNIMLDISGSMHVNGFINFLKNGPDNNVQTNDNPAGQLTYNKNTKVIEYADDKGSNTGRACPEGAIWVGFDKKDGSLTTLPRLFIQRNGLNSRVLTEFDTDIFSAINNNSSSGNIGGWNGDVDVEGNGENAFYVFRNPTDSPNNTLINTYIGRNGVTADAIAFSSSAETTNLNPLPKLYSSNAQDDDPPPAALSVIGNLSVFDFTKGGSNADYLDGNNDTLNNYKRILPSDIYTKTDTTANSINQKELGTIYMDRHLMIGGFSGLVDDTAPKFTTFTSAIDISGGIAKKPIMRVITGNSNGSLVSNLRDCQDSIIIGNTATASILGNNKQSLIFGDQVALTNVNNTIVHGSNNKAYNLTNSLVVGNNLTTGTNGGATLDSVVALGTDATLSGTDRFVFGIPDQTNPKAFVIDNEGSATIKKNLEVGGDLTVKGDKVLLELQKVIAEDKEIDMNAKESGNNIVGHSTMTNSTNEGGLRLFTTIDQADTVNLSYDNSGNANRWTTANSSFDVGLAAVGTPGSEKFRVTKNGHLVIGDGTNNVFSISNSANGNITVAPNGIGKLIINSSGTLTNNTSREEIQINGGYNSGVGASFDISKNATGIETTNLKISGKLTVDGDIDPTGLILEGTPGDYSNDGNKLVLFNSGGTLKYKVGTTEKEIATSSSGGAGSGVISGTVEAANKLATARSIAGQSFDGTADISISSGNLSDSTTFTAPKATQLANARTIAGQSFDGTADISISSGNLSDSTTFTAPKATQLANARSIAGQSFDGTADISISSGNLSDSSTFTAPKATQLANARTIAGQSFDGTADISISSGNLSDSSTFTAPKATQLANARTIAGQSFDGTGNISIAFSNLSNSNGSVTPGNYTVNVASGTSVTLSNGTTGSVTLSDGTTGTVTLDNGTTATLDAFSFTINLGNLGKLAKLQ